MADYAIHDTTLYDIADVIRKKDGTSALIDPADYAGRVNLMGMLEEKTVTGSVVAFSDGADAVKLKSCAVTISPNLDGVSSVDVVHSGKNLLLSGATSDTINGVTFTVNSDGSVTVNGTASANTAFSICNVYLKAGSYILSGAPPTGISTTYEFQVLASNGTTYREYGSGRTFTLAEGTDGLNEVRILIRKNYVADNLVFYPQLELGSTASEYEPINGETHTANLGRTVYGGTADVVNGTGADEWGRVVYTGENTENWAVTQASGIYRFYIRNDDVKAPESGRGIVYSSIGTYASSGYAVGTCYSSYSNSKVFIYYVPPQTVTTVEDFKEWLSSNNFDVVFEKATPEDFTFTAVPIISRLGDNTLWSDDGDLSVIYRSSGTQTLIPPTLISKTVTENGTYSASDEDADGYDTVTVNVSGGGGGNTPEATQTLICDNSALGSTLTFTDDYENYDLIKFVVYRSDVSNSFVFYMTPAMINACGQYSSGRVNFNQPYGNNFVCYTKTSNTAWTRYGVRNLAVKYVYGLTFTNCTVTETELYNRQGIGSSNVTFTPPTGESFLDYDYILLATCTGNSDETQVNLEIFQPDIEKDIFGSDNADENAVRVYKYNHGGTFVTVTENTITAFSYFYACGLKLSYNQQNLLGGFNSNSEQGEQENEIENELDELEQEESET